MRILYQVAYHVTPPFELNEIQEFIIKSWGGNGYHAAFSITQVASLTNTTRQQVQRAVRRLKKWGVVVRGND